LKKKNCKIKKKKDGRTDGVCAGPLGALYCDYLDWCVSTQQCAGRFSFLFVFFFPPLLLHYFLFFILFFGNVDLTRGEKSGRESRPEKGNLHGARKKKKKKKKEKMGVFPCITNGGDGPMTN
jgi:hypothetical protein